MRDIIIVFVAVAYPRQGGCMQAVRAISDAILSFLFGLLFVHVNQVVNISCVCQVELCVCVCA
jgi:hypothetical protein